LAEKFADTSADGKVTGKAEALAELKGSKQTSADYNDVTATLFGNLAIATHASPVKS
jgi:hypothetical protein